MNFAAHGGERLGQLCRHGGLQPDRPMRAVSKGPDPAQETVGALDARVRPFQRLFRRRGEHHEEARGVGAELVDQGLRIDAVALRLGHGADAAVVDRLTVGLRGGADDVAALVALEIDLFRCEILDAALVGAAREDVVEHHALRQQVGEGLVVVHQPEVAHDLGPEARVKQVQDRVLDAADVLVGRHPVVGAGIDHGRVRRARRRVDAVAGVVPRRIDEGVHGVGFALGRLAALRAGAIDEIGALRQRIAGTVGHAVFGQRHGQLVVGHRHRAARVAMDQRNRAAPVALARHAPVAQAVLHLGRAEVLGRQVSGDGGDGSFEPESIVLAGIHTAAALLVGVPLLPAVERKGLAFHCNHLPDRQAVLLRKLEIAFVMRRHGHHGAFAVAHQHVVADPDLDFFAGQRVVDENAGRHALLFHGRHVGFHHRAVLAFVDEGGELRIVLRRVRGQRMFGGDGAEGHAHDGVGAGGEYPQMLVPAVELVGKGEAHADALADPVGLHGLDPLRPARQRVERREQLVGIFRDGQVVAGDLALLDHRAGAPAPALDDLFVGQHGLVDRVPIHHLGLLVGDALFQHAQEQPLVPLVVLGRAGRQFALPVEGETQRLELLLHVGDVVPGPLRRRYPVLHRGVLRRQAESVPAHGLQDVVALHPVVAGEHIADGIVPHVPHVQLARRIGEHRQAVVLRLVGVFRSAEGLRGVPVGLRGLLDFGRKIFFLHGRGFCFEYWQGLEL